MRMDRVPFPEIPGTQPTYDVGRAPTGDSNYDQMRRDLLCATLVSRENDHYALSPHHAELYCADPLNRLVEAVEHRAGGHLLAKGSINHPSLVSPTLRTGRDALFTDAIGRVATDTAGTLAMVVKAGGNPGDVKACERAIDRAVASKDINRDVAYSLREVLDYARDPDLSSDYLAELINYLGRDIEDAVSGGGDGYDDEWDEDESSDTSLGDDAVADAMSSSLAELLGKRTPSGKVGEDGLFLDSRTIEGSVPWCPADIIEPRLPNKLPARLLARVAGADDTGAIPHHLHRLCSDGRIFRHPRRRPAASVLIDCSGSMNLTSDEIQRILFALPGSIVATYCGDGHRGEIRVIARGGRYANPRELTNHSMGGNCVDGPAMDWLIRQPAPRIWVCDGAITGYGDQFIRADLAGELRYKARGAQVQQALDMDGIPAALVRARAKRAGLV